MIIERYISKEIILSLIGISLILLLLVVGNRFMVILGDAVSGQVGAKFVFSILYMNTITLLGFIIPFAFYLATLLAFGRLYKDSEMSALQACGVGYRPLIRANMFVGGISATVVFILSLYVGPWASSEIQLLQQRSKQQSDIQVFKSGEFRTSENGANVIYIETADTEHAQLHTIFAHGEGSGQSYSIYADTGYQHRDADTGQRFLVMQNGRRYSGKIGDADYQVVEFQRYTLRIDNEKEAGPAYSLSSSTIASLLANLNPRTLAELHWRLGLPIATLLLGFIAIPLSRTNPRQGRYSKLFVAILIFAVYVNLLGMGKVWLEKGVIPTVVGLWWVHLLMLSFSVFAISSQIGIRWRFRFPQVKLT